MRGSLQPPCERGTRCGGQLRRKHGRRPADMPELHTHGAVSANVSEFQPIRISSPVHRRIAVCEATLRLAYAGRPYVSRGADRETVHEPWRRWAAVPIADSA